MRATSRSGRGLKDDTGVAQWYLILFLMAAAAAITTFAGTRAVVENKDERTVGGMTMQETFEDAPASADPCVTNQSFYGRPLIIPVSQHSCPKPTEGAQVTGRVGSDEPSIQTQHDDDPAVIYVDPSAYATPEPEDYDPHGGSGGSSVTTNCVNGVCTSTGGGGTTSSGGGDPHGGGGEIHDPPEGGGGGTS